MIEKKYAMTTQQYRNHLKLLKNKIDSEDKDDRLKFDPIDLPVEIAIAQKNNLTPHKDEDGIDNACRLHL